MSLAPKLVIELPGEPRSKERPRLGKYGNVYTPVATAGYERSLGWAAKIAMQGRKPLEGPLRVTVTAFVGGRRRVDIDNVAKCALDSLNGIAYLDDAQVVDLHARKAFAAEPMTRVEIEPMN
jgi:crossover junction endodeoxyribonuclease RusA